MVAGCLRNYCRRIGWNTFWRFCLLVLWLAFSFGVYLFEPDKYQSDSWSWKNYKKYFKEMYSLTDVMSFIYSPFMFFAFILIEWALYLSSQRESDAMFRASAIIREDSKKSRSSKNNTIASNTSK